MIEIQRSGQRASAPPRDWSLGSTAAHTLVVIGLVLLFAFLITIRDALLLAFVAIIIACAFEAISRPLMSHVGMSRRPALAVVVLGVGVLFAGAIWLVGSQMQAQVLDLVDRLPGALRSAEQRFGFSMESLLDSEGMLNGWITSEALPSLASLGQMIVGAVTSAVLAVVIGIFIAAQPELYAGGLVKLFPTSQHRRIRRALASTGGALRQWLVAQAMAMVAVGVMAGVGAWLLGLPSPLAIGLVVGLFEFVPLVGPVIAALPALVLALSESVTLFAATLGLFVVIQQVEGNLITPIAQHRAASIPPALLLISVACSAIVFGFAGIIVAAPLAVVGLNLVQRLYVEDTLDEEVEEG